LAFLEQPNGGHLYYELIEGPADRPVLAFLHEGLGCTAMWKAFPQRLCAATKHPGLVYDRAGYGRSSPAHRDRTIHYLHESALQELPAVLEGAIGTRDHILVGHSDGGSIALIYAAERRPTLCGVITEAAHVFVEAETITGIEVAVRAYEAGDLAGLTHYHGDKTDCLFWAWAHTWLTPWFRSWNIEYALPSIQYPVLALQGADDQFGTAAQVNAIVAGNPHRRGLVVEGSGHTPHGDQPEVLLGVMGEFIAEITSLKWAI
jgi:pimeloyl-ACP methyl ester carboxylesterase